jgi:peptidoglycan pentaglycine glycine transferase (the first glycine)
MQEYLSLWGESKFRNLWQHPVWAEFQNAAGRKTWILTSHGASALVIKHSLPFGFSWLEVPRGPLFESEKGLSETLSEIVKTGKKEKAVFVRMNPYSELVIGHAFCVVLRSMNWSLVIAKHDHHPQTSLILDLTKTESEILAQMKPKGRYNIKLAEKHGVTVKQSSDVGDFYSILSKTGNRDGFGIHPQAYYKKMLDSLGKNAQLLLAEHQGKVIAGGIFVYLDEWGIYYYGASDSEFRNLMAPYLVQWEAIKEAKKRGCKFYDFLGIAPENAKNHPWAGVTEFKKKFGGQVTEYPQAKDMVLKPFFYWLYRLYKKCR